MISLSHISIPCYDFGVYHKLEKFKIHTYFTVEGKIITENFIKLKVNLWIKFILLKKYNFNMKQKKSQ